MKSPWRAALAVAVVVGAYLAFRAAGVPTTSEGVAKIVLWVVPCALALRLAGARSYGDVLDELGLRRGLAIGYGFGLMATVPTLVLLPFGGSLFVNGSALLNGVLLGPLAEEVLFRGYLLRQLVRRGGWPAMPAIVVSAIAFGLAHLGNVDLRSAHGQWFGALEVVMMTGGGLLFGWIVIRWGSLWPAIGLHTCMNLAWQIFGVNDWAAGTQTAAAADGSTISNVARLATIVLAVAMTLALRQRPARDGVRPGQTGVRRGSDAGLTPV
jgi:CAAX protease family protein